MRFHIEPAALAPPRRNAWDEAAIAESRRVMRERELHRSFSQIADRYKAGFDYEIETRRSSGKILCAAWHGGFIEPGSDLLADAIAGSRHHYYAFRALFSGQGEEHPLHITSSRFQEPKLIELAAESEMVLGVHCCTTAPGVHRIFVGGGAHESVRMDLILTLRASGFNTGPDKIFSGSHFMNPCNRGRRPGIQLEVSQTYMDHLVAHEAELFRLAAVISNFLGTV